MDRANWIPFAIVPPMRRWSVLQLVSFLGLAGCQAWEVHDLSRDRAEDVLRRKVTDNAAFPLPIPGFTPTAP
jgi:hypothetical protein